MQDFEQASDQDTASNVLTILFAEDDQFVRDLVSVELQAHRYLVMEAATGDDALPLLQAGDIDVLATDILMPGELDGWSLAEQARLLHPQIPIIYTSSRPADAARQVSGSLYIRKPYRPEALLVAIHHLTSW